MLFLRQFDFTQRNTAAILFSMSRPHTDSYNPHLSIFPLHGNSSTVFLVTDNYAKTITHCGAVLFVSRLKTLAYYTIMDWTPSLDENVSHGGICAARVILPREYPAGIVRVFARKIHDCSLPSPGTAHAVITLEAAKVPSEVLQLRSAGVMSRSVTGMPVFTIPGRGVGSMILELSPTLLNRPPAAISPLIPRDMWRVDIRNADVSFAPFAAAPAFAASPLVLPMHSGAYLIEVPLRTLERGLPEQLYIGELFLEQATFTPSNLTSVTCRPTRDADSRVAYFFIVVINAAAAIPLSHAACLPQNATPTPCGRLPSHIASRGWYENAQPGDRGTAPKRWRPRDCTLSYFSNHAASLCLSRKWIAFVGDSTVEELAIATVLVTGATFNESWAKSGCSHEWTRARVFDTLDTPLSLSPPSLPHGRISMTWAAAPDACGNFVGVRTFADANFSRKLTLALSPNNTGWTTAPDVVVYSSGLHDLENRHTPITLSSYATDIRGILLRLRSLTRGGKGIVIVKTSNPKGAKMSCSGWQANVGEAGVQALNNVLEKTVEELAQNATELTFRLLDEHALLLPLSADTSELLQHHCSAVLHQPRVLSAVHSGCLATVHVLLDAICQSGEG